MSAGRKSRAARGSFVPRLLIAAIPLTAAGAADAKTELSVGGSLSARASQNPYLDASGGGGGGTLSLVGALSPRLTISEAESQISIGGSVQHTEYTRFYPSSDAVFANLNANRRFSPKWSGYASLSYDNSIAGENGFFTFDRLGPDGEVLPPTADDLTLAGRRIKRQLISGQVGLAYQPNARETVNFSLFASDTRSPVTLDTQNSSSYGNTFSYTRQLSRRTSVGFTNTSLRYECRDRGRCFTNSYQPQLTISTTLGREWTLSGSAGATFSQIRLPSENADNISPAGSVTLCRRKTRLDVCLSASQTIETTVSTGARPSLALTSVVSYRLDQKSTVGFNGGYTRSAGSALNSQDYDLLMARVFGSRSIGRNVSFTVDGGYDRTASPFQGTRSNFSVSMGVNFSLGRTL